MSFNRNQFPSSFSSSKSKRSPRSYQEQHTHPPVDPNFNNIFTFDKYGREWCLPDASLTFASEAWDIPILQTLKSDLNVEKNRLNDYCIEEWSLHTKKRNVAGDVRWKIRSTIDPEFLTQAWTKFYECAFTFNIISEDARKRNSFNSVHLCEAPGAFVASLNHFLKLNFKELQWIWMASTLNPYYENNSFSSMICDDRFIFYTLDHWDFGLDYSGNLMDWDNSQHLINKGKMMGKIDLVTADGSINCMLQPDEQEKVVTPLHFCEIITALQMLSEGGSLIIKLFTIFEHTTVNLMYILAVSFDSVNMFKPVTSKHGNSEVYAICTGYSGLSTIKKLIEKIQTVYGSEEVLSKALFPLHCLPTDFLAQIESCALFFYNIQVATIDDNISTYENPHLRKEISFKKYRSAIACTFIKRYELSPIDAKDKILKGMPHDDTMIHLNPRNCTGSFNERHCFTQLSKHDEIANIQNEILSLNGSIASDDNFSNLWIDCEELQNVDLNFTFGKPVERIRSSKFVLAPILTLFNKTQDLYLNHCGIINVNVKTSESNITLKKNHILFQSHKSTENFDDWEKACIGIIYAKLKLLNVGDTLILENYSLLTQFNIGILYTIAVTSFLEIGFIRDNVVHLKGFQNKSNVLRILETVASVQKSTRDSKHHGKQTILRVVPIQILGHGKFYQSLLHYNNYELLRSMNQMISSIDD